MRTFLKVYALFLFGAMGRTMFHLAYLGASAERELRPGKLEAPYFLSIMAYMMFIIWSITIIRKKDLPYAFVQGVLLTGFSAALTLYLYLNH